MSPYPCTGNKTMTDYLMTRYNIGGLEGGLGVCPPCGQLFCLRTVIDLAKSSFKRRYPLSSGGGAFDVCTA